MAGHSKWKNIKIRKGKQDAIRGKVFTKLSREIIVAARMGGGDPDLNPRLRLSILKARNSSVPKENIERSIQRGTGEIEGAAYEELTYEGYGPGGAAILLECYTENRNRTVAEVRHAFSKANGNLAENGSVSWQFSHVGQITVPAEGTDEETLTLQAIEAGADDVALEDDAYVVTTSLEALHTVNDNLEKMGVKPTDVGLTYVATNKVEPVPDDVPKLMRLLELLDDLDDVNETYVNVDIQEEWLLDE